MQLPVASRILASLLTLCIMSMQVQAQSTQTIRGRIVDEVNNTPLPGVNIVIASSIDKQLGSTTDVEGNYRIENVPVGRQSLKITYVGYEDQTISNIVVTAG